MRLIDADALKKKVYPFPCAIGVENAVTIRAINEAPTIEPKRGEWIVVTNGRGGHECSECHSYAPSFQNGSEHESTYCPNCGCNMRSEDVK